jgi:succinyl-diaminopimelate desuccinylase
MNVNIEQVLRELIGYESITPFDVGCQDYIISLLESLNFTCERFDNPPVSNFFARFGESEPLLVFAGHTDVVPIGDESSWDTPPFVLSNQEGILYGRGVADMKGSIAAMLVAAQQFVTNHPKPIGSLGFLITSGEEGDHFHLGTEYVMAKLHEAGIHPDYCIVGEPSSTQRLGDVIKVGRRGSLSGKLTLRGKQGHVAYPHLALNPIHAISPVLQELISLEWDKGNAHFPPTSFQITRIEAGGAAGNIIPGEVTLDFNIRYSTEQTDSILKKTVNDCFKRYQLSPSIQWRLNGEPFLTSHGKLIEHCKQAIQHHTGLTTECSTSGGTSDGRFIAPYGVEVIELGPINASIHQVNECVALADLEMLSKIYFMLCQSLLS